MQTCYFGKFGNAWQFPSKIIVSICRKRSCLYVCNRSTRSLTCFLKYCKEIANLLLWVICACLASPQLKWEYQFEEIFDVYLQAKNQLHSFHFPWDITKILQVFHSGYFGQGCLHTPKMILAPCRNFRIYLQAE